MKCEGCGYELHIEDKVCPHCQRENPYYRQYRVDKDFYESDLADTKKEVQTKTKTAVDRLIKVMVMMALVIAEAVLLVRGFQKSYVPTELEIPTELETEPATEAAEESTTEKYSEEELAEAIALLWQYEEAEDYIMFNAVYYQYALWQDGALDGQNYLEDMGNAIPKYVMFLSYLFEYLTDEDTDYAYHRMAESTYFFYYQLGITQKRVADVALHTQVLQDMQAEMEAVLVAYVGLDPETAADLENMTQEEIEKVFEEAEQ